MASLAGIANTPPASKPATSKPKRLRSACDGCHQSKVKCSGGVPCEGCQKLGIRCKYSTSNRTGRPKGVKNKKTLERIKHIQEVSLREDEATLRRISNCPSPSAPIMHNANPDRIKHSTVPDPGDAYYEVCHHNPSSVPDCTTLPFWNFFDVSQSASFPADVRSFGSVELSAKALSADNSSNSSLFEPLPPDNVRNALSQNLSWFDDLSNTFGLTCGQQNEDNFGGGQNSTDHGVLVNAVSTIPSTQTASRSRMHILSTCECLQQLTSLLAHFKELSRARDPLEPDIVLVTARDALSCWQRHLHCGTCQEKGDEDILLVFVMGFREMLSLIHRVSRPERHQTGDKTATISPRQFQPTICPEIHVKDGPSQTLNQENSFLGMYKLSKEEKPQVVDVLLYRALENINRTAKHIKQRSTKALGNFADVDSGTPSIPSPTPTNEIPSRPSSEDGMDSSDDCSTPDEAQDYLRRSFSGLSKSIESLQHTLQCFQSSV